MAGSWLAGIAGCCVLAVACGGKSLNESPGAAGGNGSAGRANGGASNGALTPEIRDTGIPLDSVLGQLDGAEQSALCEAYGAWRFRLRDPMCAAYVQSAVILEPHTTQEMRQLCADHLDICRLPTEPTSACTGFPPGCAVTVAEFDRCIVDSEDWLNKVPTCQDFSYETAQSGPGPSPDSCVALSTTCQAP